MSEIGGSYRRADMPIVYFEAKQDGERWRVTVKIGGERFEQTTWAPSPWSCVEKLIAEALDSTARSGVGFAGLASLRFMSNLVGSLSKPRPNRHRTFRPDCAIRLPRNGNTRSPMR